ncbi:cell envelope biogenesis protein OmpA [Microbulbifer flavimaris]|uniref:Cell envelope biogenesis protein OmpA n=1 Tax=Microbulbifer flavimaris TaxID=1781068 RepID=A0ABX4HXS6_9GAMM|nr:MULTISPECIES: cell envelope biogenesis protein OmpA [Microbulbifer]KUJ82663.1 cell envelope biogenesis protein OmpA [Microbulbifer sp. ZGT114]PCO04876.1 cell envelope biogenesis protein OmpA [Microbulbifer flavimaris]
MPNNLRSISRAADDGEWLSVSDLMAGLMMVFLCISIVMMRSMMEEREKIRALAQSYRDNQLAIYQTLVAEFEGDLPRWGATIDKDRLIIAFNNSDAMFTTGEAEMNLQAQRVMEDFFPRYITALKPYLGSIRAIHIEGHTSSEWGDGGSSNDNYFKNLRLSQSRSREVLHHVQGLVPDAEVPGMLALVAAVGYSSARPVLRADGSEDPEKSKRVAFRVITNSEAQIHRILEEAL